MNELSSRTIFSIGHSNKDVAVLVGLLTQHEIHTVVDVRSAPYSKYCPQFNKPALERAMLAAGVTYVYLGDRLGGMPRGEGLIDDDGHPRYDRIAGSRPFIDGIERLITLASEHRCAIMCAEENPRHCHRHRLIEPALLSRNIDVRHIRGDGRIETSDEVDGRKPDSHPSLFQ